MTILSASFRQRPLPLCGQRKNRKPATASLSGDPQTGSSTVSDSANRKQVGQLNKCRLVTGTNRTSSDRYHCISMPQVGQVGTSRSSSECFSLSITTLPRSSDESPKPFRLSLYSQVRRWICYLVHGFFQASSGHHSD